MSTFASMLANASPNFRHSARSLPNLGRELHGWVDCRAEGRSSAICADAETLVEMLPNVKTPANYMRAFLDVTPFQFKGSELGSA